MNLSDDQKEMMAVFVKKMPSIGNDSFLQNELSAISITLNWTHTRAMAVFKELVTLGAFKVHEGGITFITPDGGEAGRQALLEQAGTAKRASEAALRTERKWDVTVMLVGGVIAGSIGFGFGLLTLYLAHRWGWNK